MPIKTIVGLSSVITILLIFMRGLPEATHLRSAKVIVSTSQNLRKMKFKIAIVSTGGQPITKNRDMVSISLDNLDLVDGDLISLEFAGPDQTVVLGGFFPNPPIGIPPGPVHDLLQLSDPNGKGVRLKSAKGETLAGFRARAVYRVSRRRLVLRLTRGDINVLPRVLPLSSGNKKATDPNAAFTTILKVSRNGEDIEVTNTTTFTIRNRLNSKKLHIKSAGKSN